ncbi:MAG: metal-dependent transcriptional regulator [Candidatus Eiseniibacteriota bacterium]
MSTITHPKRPRRAPRKAVQPLTRSRQDFLKALLDLASEGTPTPTSRLARRLGISAPSVTNMLGRLRAEGLVRHVPRGGAWLTARGTRSAIHVVRRHRLIETYLVRVLRLDWAAAHDEAEVLEHGVSDRVLAAIDRQMRHPREDPHGHPIPDARGRMARRRLVPLAALPAGGHGKVREIVDRDRGRMARWKQAGLVPGAGVLMRAVQSVDDLFVLEVEGRRMVTGSEGLDGVMIERTHRRAHAR